MDIIGHQKNIYFLEKSIINNKLSHAYLFYGSRNIGKSTVAEYFVARLFCRQKNSPCGQCNICQQIIKRIHPDVFWIHGSLKREKISIEQARQVQMFLFSSPFAAPYKVAIIEEADDLTLQAANSLLKILEEPPEKSIIILISRSFNNIISTLRSRCQILKFNFPTKEEIAVYLENRFSFSRSESLEILNLALGQPGKAIEFAQDGEKVEQKKKLTDKILLLLNGEDMENKFKLAALIADSGISPDQGLESLLIIARDILLVGLDLNPTNESFIKQLKFLSRRHSLERVGRFIEEIYQTKFLLAANVNVKMAIENLLINSL